MEKPDAAPAPDSADVRTHGDQLWPDGTRVADSPMADPVQYERSRVLAEAEIEFRKWVTETFHNVPGLTTEHFNRFRDAADRYVARLRAKEI